MKLHSNPASPFARKVRALLVETGQTDAVEERVFMTTPLDTDAELAAVNPIGKIPCLERPDGPALYDSRVICRYLDSRHDGAKMYPDGERQWSAITLEATADGMMEAALAIVYEGRLRPAEKHVPELLDAQRAKIDRAMSALESRWMAHLNGPVDMGWIALGCALGYIDFRLKDWSWTDRHQTLAAWYAGAATRPCLAETAPE